MALKFLFEAVLKPSSIDHYNAKLPVSVGFLLADAAFI